MVPWGGMSWDGHEKSLLWRKSPPARGWDCPPSKVPVDVEETSCSEGRVVD